MRTVSRSRPNFCNTLTATPWPSLMRPSSRCSVPTKLWLKRSASLRARASTCCARGVKLFMASSLIYYFTMQSFYVFVHSAARGRRLADWPADRPQSLAHHVSSQQIAFLSRKFLRMLLLQVGRLGQNEQFIHQRPIYTGKQAHIHAHLH